MVSSNPITLTDGSAIMTFPYEKNSRFQDILKVGRYINCLTSLRISNGKNEYEFIKVTAAEPTDIILHIAAIIDQQLPED